MINNVKPNAIAQMMQPHPGFWLSSLSEFESRFKSFNHSKSILDPIPL